MSLYIGSSLADTSLIHLGGDNVQKIESIVKTRSREGFRFLLCLVFVSSDATASGDRARTSRFNILRCSSTFLSTRLRSRFGFGRR